MRPPMPYGGGKQTIAARIVALLPEHVHYVEPFAGALSVLLAKPVSAIETVNDLDGEIVAFWRVLRDRPAELERVCALTPHSRQEYDACRRGGDADDDLARAWRTWVRLTQGRGSRPGASSGWRTVHGGNRMALARYLDGYLERIAPVARRLRLVSLEHRPALEVIAAYDKPDALFYVDPPYLGSTRYREDMYRCEMSDTASHEVLLDALRGCAAKVVLSGYRSDMYDRRLRDWARIDFPAHSMTGTVRIESVWLNFSPAPTLLEADA